MVHSTVTAWPSVVIEPLSVSSHVPVGSDGKVAIGDAVSVRSVRKLRVT